MDDTPRILHALSVGPPATVGYVVRSVSQMLAQRRLGAGVQAVLSPQHTLRVCGRRGRPDESAIHKDGLVFRLFDPADFGFSDRLRYRFLDAPLLTGSKTYWGEMRKMHRAFARRVAETLETVPQVVVVHSPAAWTEFGFELAEILGCPAVYDIHGAIEETNAARAGGRYRSTRRYRLMREAESRAARRAAHCFVICQALLDDFVRRGIPEEKMTLVPNGIDAGEFAERPERDPDLARRLGLGESRVIGYVTSMCGYEAIETVAAAVGLLRCRSLDVKGLFVGDGDARKGFEAAARRLGVEEHVVFAGRVPRDEIPKYLALIDFFVVSRKDERVCRLVTPLKPFEAMAAGRPLALSDLPALREVAGDGKFAYLFPAEDASALADLYEGILKAPKVVAAKTDAARQWVLKERSWDRLAETQLAEIARLVRSGAPPL